MLGKSSGGVPSYETEPTRTRPGLRCHSDPKTTPNHSNSSRPLTTMRVRSRAHGRGIDRGRLDYVCNKVCDEETACDVEYSKSRKTNRRDASYFWWGTHNLSGSSLGGRTLPYLIPQPALSKHISKKKIHVFNMQQWLVLLRSRTRHVGISVALMPWLSCDWFCFVLFVFLCFTIFGHIICFSLPVG